MQVVAPRADAVRFSAFWVRAPQDTPPPPPESLVLSLSGLPAVVVASRVAGVRTILMQVVAPRADAVRFSAFWVRAPQDTPPPPGILGFVAIGPASCCCCESRCRSSDDIDAGGGTPC